MIFLKFPVTRSVVAALCHQQQQEQQDHLTGGNRCETVRPPMRDVGGDNCGSLQEECLEFSAVTLMVDKHETEILSESFILTSTTSGMSLSFM